MKFCYKKLTTEISRPIIKVKISVGDEHFFSEALVDSGADECIFDSEFARLLGIKVEDGIKKETGGIAAGIKVPYYLHSVVLNVGGWDNKTKVGFMPNFPIKMGVSGILGHKGFFEFYKVTFNTFKQEVEVRSLKELRQ